MGMGRVKRLPVPTEPSSGDGAVINVNGFRQTSTPAIDDLPFCAIPTRLWDELLRLEPGADESELKFDEDLLKRELDVASACCDMTAEIGVWGNSPIACGLVRRLPVSIAAENASFLGMTESQLTRFDAITAERAKYFRDNARAYGGWIVSGAEFAHEHDTIISKWANEIKEWRLPLRGPSMSRSDAARFGEIAADDRFASFHQDFKDFYIRWRLQGLAAPYVPIPLTPQASGQLPATVLDQLGMTGGFFYFPDTFPVPGRDTMRDIIDEALHDGEQPEHLAGWRRIISKDNTAKRELSAWSYIFEVQYYW